MRCNFSRNHSTGPSSASSDCHAIVRSRNDVKNGNMTAPSITFFHRPALKAMK